MSEARITSEKRASYSLLERVEVVLGQCVRLCDDGDEVYACPETLHDFNVQGLEPNRKGSAPCENGVRKGHGRVTSRTDKIEASMHSEVRLVGPQRLLFLSHVRLVLVIDEVDNGGPRVAVVDIITKAGCVNDGQLGFELLLLQLGLDDFDLGQLVKLLEVTAVVVLRGR